MLLRSAQGMDVAATAQVTFASPPGVREVLHSLNSDAFDSLREARRRTAGGSRRRAPRGSSRRACWAVRTC